MALDVHLTRTCPDVQWGFHLYGGKEYFAPLTVVQIQPLSLAYEAGLCEGDTIIMINDEAATNMTQCKANEIIMNSRILGLRIIRRCITPIPMEINTPLPCYELPCQEIYRESTEEVHAILRPSSPFFQPSRQYRPFSNNPVEGIPPLEHPIILSPKYKDDFSKLKHEDFEPTSFHKLKQSNEYRPEDILYENVVKATETIKDINEIANDYVNVVDSNESLRRFNGSDVFLKEVQESAVSTVDECIVQANFITDEIKRVSFSESQSNDSVNITSVYSESHIDDTSASSLLAKLIDQATDEIIEFSSKKESQSNLSECSKVKTESSVCETKLESHESVISTEKHVEDIKSIDIKSESCSAQEIKAESNEIIESCESIQKYDVKDDRSKQISESAHSHNTQKVTETKAENLERKEVLENIKTITQQMENVETSNKTINELKHQAISAANILTEQKTYQSLTIPSIHGSFYSSHHYDLLLKTFFIHLTDVMVALSRLISADHPIIQPKTTASQTTTQQTTQTQNMTTESRVTNSQETKNVSANFASVIESDNSVEYTVSEVDNKSQKTKDKAISQFASQTSQELTENVGIVTSELGEKLALMNKREVESKDPIEWLHETQGVKQEKHDTREVKRAETVNKAEESAQTIQESSQVTQDSSKKTEEKTQITQESLQSDLIEENTTGNVEGKIIYVATVDCKESYSIEALEKSVKSEEIIMQSESLHEEMSTVKETHMYKTEMFEEFNTGSHIEKKENLQISNEIIKEVQEISETKAKETINLNNKNIIPEIGGVYNHEIIVKNLIDVSNRNAIKVHNEVVKTTDFDLSKHNEIGGNFKSETIVKDVIDTTEKQVFSTDDSKRFEIGGIYQNEMIIKGLIGIGDKRLPPNTLDTKQLVRDYPLPDSPITPPGPLSDEYMFRLSLALVESKIKPVVTPNKVTNAHEDPYIVRKPKLIPHYESYILTNNDALSDGFIERHLNEMNKDSIDENTKVVDDCKREAIMDVSQLTACDLQTMNGTIEGILNGATESIVDDSVIKQLGKPGLSTAQVSEIATNDAANMMREAHIMGLQRVLTSHMNKLDEDLDASQQIKPLISSLKDSEVLKALNEEILQLKEEQKKKDAKRWTTFLQKPARPIPSAKYGHNIVPEFPKDSYKVKIVKQPKPKVAPDYKPKDFETGPLPWEERAANEPAEPPIQPEEPILIPEEGPEVLEAIDNLPESEVPDLLDTGIPLPKSPVPQEPSDPVASTETLEIENSAATIEIVEVEPEEEDMEQQKLAAQVLNNVQSIVDPSASMEEQLLQMRAQLTALAQLPEVIHQTLELVTKQLGNLTQVKTEVQQQSVECMKSTYSEETVLTTETRECESAVSQQETAEYSANAVETAEYAACAVETAVERSDETAGSKQEMEAIVERLKKDEEAMKQIDQQKKELLQQIQEEHVQTRLKQRPTPQPGRPKPVFGPLVPQERPLILPGGRKWRKPKDAYNEDFIRDTLLSQAEVINGKAMGINFKKFEKPPVSLDHLKDSDVYKLVHSMETYPARGIDQIRPMTYAESDIREKCRSMTPCID